MKIVKNKKNTIVNINNEYTPALVRYEIDTLGMTQKDFAVILNVSSVAITRAINNDPGLKSLREKIIQLIQTKKSQRHAS